MDGTKVSETPRTVMLNDWYHHRGQLAVYLRLLDIPVPSIYGPSADEHRFGAKRFDKALWASVPLAKYVPCTYNVEGVEYTLTRKPAEPLAIGHKTQRRQT